MLALTHVASLLPLPLLASRAGDILLRVNYAVSKQNKMVERYGSVYQVSKRMRTGNSRSCFHLPLLAWLTLLLASLLSFPPTQIAAPAYTLTKRLFFTQHARLHAARAPALLRTLSAELDLLTRFDAHTQRTSHDNEANAT